MNDIQILMLMVTGGFFLMGIMWRHMTKSFEKIDEKFKELDNRLSGKIEDVDRRLGEKIEDVDRRLCRIEGSLATQGHCLFTQSKSENKRVE